MTVQVENGYIRIATELFEAIYALQLGGYEMRVLLAIARKTYGYQKKEDYIALSQLSETTKIAKTHVSRTIKSLISMGIVTKNGNSIGINKDYHAWKVTKLGKGGKLPKMVKPVTKIGNEKLPNQALQKIKDNITKDIVTNVTTAKQYGNPEINEVIAYMKDTLHLPTLDRSVQMNRNFAQLCIKKYGFQNTKLAILAASKSNFWRHKLTSFQSLYNNAQQIVGSARGEVKSYDATKILSKSGQEGVYIVPGGIPNIKAES